MKFVITTGGTAGHINPAIALAQELKKRGHEVVFAGTPNRLESRLVPQAGYEFKGFEARGFNRNKPWTIVPAVSSIMSATKQATSWLKQIKPDAVIGFGCYVSLAICRAAKKLNIPFAVHEQNSVMGMANKYLSKYANATCLTYKRADTGKCKNVLVTGNPVRADFFTAKKSDGRAMLKIPEDSTMLLVFGGSLGAKHLNEALINMASELLERENLYIVHLTGASQFDNVKDALNLDNDKKKRYIVMPYQDKMAQTLAACDLCVSRAGASTLAEITACAVPALLVPYPYATENHQFHNAQTLFDAGCVKYINDEEVKSEKFKSTVIDLIDNKDKRDKMRDAYKQFDAKNSAIKLADIIENL